MKNYDYGYGFKPISAWGYVGYNILWAIPVVGFIIWLYHALGASNRNVKNYARSYACMLLLLLMVCILLSAVVITFGQNVRVEEYYDVFTKFIPHDMI